jgi:Fic family protein
MDVLDLNTYELDASYKQFPSFKEWIEWSKIDLARWERYVTRFTSLKEQATKEMLHKSLEVVKRAAAWDTGSIEGLYSTNLGITITIARQNAMWEAAVNQQGEDARKLFDGQLHAYDFVLDFATQSVPIVPAWIRELHKEITTPQDTYRALTSSGFQQLELPKGEYKTLPNHVIGRDDKPHAYAPVDVTPMEVRRLCDEMNSELFLSAQPIHQASYAHYAFVVIHPFADGNGRVARALASVFTYRSLSVPLLILVENRPQYIAALESADQGEIQPFVSFVFERTLDSIQLFKESLQAAEAPEVDDAIAKLKTLYFTKGGYTHAQVDAAGVALIDNFHKALLEQGTKLKGNNDEFSVSGNVVQVQKYQLSKESSRLPMGVGRQAIIELSTKAPANAALKMQFTLEVPKNCDVEDEFVVRDIQTGQTFEARMNELVPHLSPALQMRMTIAAEGIMTKAIPRLVEMAVAAMKQKNL